MCPEESFVPEIVLKITDIITDKMITFYCADPHILVLRLHKYDVSKIDKKLLAILSYDKLSFVLLARCNMLQHFSELIHTDRLRKIPQRIHFITFNGIFHVSREENDIKLLMLCTELSGERYAVDIFRNDLI